MSENESNDKKIATVGDSISKEMDVSFYSTRVPDRTEKMKKAKSKPLKVKKVMTPEQNRVRAMMLKHQKYERDVIKAITKKYDKDVVGLINAPDHTIRITPSTEKSLIVNGMDVSSVLPTITLYAGSVILGKVEVLSSPSLQDLVDGKLYIGRVLDIIVIFKLTNYTTSVSFAKTYPDPILFNIIRSLYIATLEDSIKQSKEKLPDDHVHFYVHQVGYFPEPIDIVPSSDTLLITTRKHKPIYESTFGFKVNKNKTDKMFCGDCKSSIILMQVYNMLSKLSPVDKPDVE